MDAGNFSKINNVGFTPKAPVRKAETQQDADPSDQVTIGAAPAAKEGNDVVTVGGPQVPVRADGADQVVAGSHAHEVDGGFLIAGAGPAQGASKTQFPGLAGSLNGVGHTKLMTIDGRVLADLSPLAGIGEGRPTAPAVGVDGLNGLHSTQFETFNGRLIQL